MRQDGARSTIVCIAGNDVSCVRAPIERVGGGPPTYDITL
jgi:hypothetical protein